MRCGLGASENIEGNAAPDCRSGNGRRRWFDGTVLHDIHDAIDSGITFLAVDAPRFDFSHVVSQNCSLDDGVPDVIVYLGDNALLAHEQMRWHVEERSNSARQVQSGAQAEL